MSIPDLFPENEGKNAEDFKIMHEPQIMNGQKLVNWQKIHKNASWIKMQFNKFYLGHLEAVNQGLCHSETDKVRVVNQTITDNTPVSPDWGILPSVAKSGPKPGKLPRPPGKPPNPPPGNPLKKIHNNDCFYDWFHIFTKPWFP